MTAFVAASSFFDSTHGKSFCGPYRSKFAVASKQLQKHSNTMEIALSKQWTQSYPTTSLCKSHFVEHLKNYRLEHLMQARSTQCLLTYGGCTRQEASVYKVQKLCRWLQFRISVPPTSKLLRLNVERFGNPTKISHFLRKTQVRAHHHVT